MYLNTTYIDVQHTQTNADHRKMAIWQKVFEMSQHLGSNSECIVKLDKISGFVKLYGKICKGHWRSENKHYPVGKMCTKGV